MACEHRRCILCAIVNCPHGLSLAFHIHGRPRPELDRRTGIAIALAALRTQRQRQWSKLSRIRINRAHQLSGGEERAGGLTRNCRQMRRSSLPIIGVFHVLVPYLASASGLKVGIREGGRIVLSESPQPSILPDHPQSDQSAVLTSCSFPVISLFVFGSGESLILGFLQCVHLE